jgi:hypothetical protein
MNKNKAGKDFLDNISISFSLTEKQHNASVTGPRVAARAIQATGPRHDKRTRAAPVHATLCIAHPWLHGGNRLHHGCVGGHSPRVTDSLKQSTQIAKEPNAPGSACTRSFAKLAAFPPMTVLLNQPLVGLLIAGD